MTFHPLGRTSSATHLNNKEWMDMNMFQSGHRRYAVSYTHLDVYKRQGVWFYSKSGRLWYCNGEDSRIRRINIDLNKDLAMMGTENIRKT